RRCRESWAERSRRLLPASAEGEIHADVVPEDEDTAGRYAWIDGAHGELRARRQMEALQVDGHVVRGEGTWRRLAPGAQFELLQHPAHTDPEGRHFSCLRVRHEARNNLGAEILDALEQALGPVALPEAQLPEALSGLGRSGSAAAARELPQDHFYRNT